MQRMVKFEDIQQFDLVADVVVVGFGGAGASAALEARRAGSDVLVLERSSGGGGSTMMSACEMYLGGSGGTRLQKDLGAGSTFGFVGTGVRRDIDGTDPLSRVLARQAFTGGLDWNIRFAGQSHELGGFVGGRVVEGEPARIAVAAVQDSRHLALVTQAAARTFALVVPELGANFECGLHWLLSPFDSLTHRTPRPEAALLNTNQYTNCSPTPRP